MVTFLLLQGRRADEAVRLTPVASRDHGRARSNPDRCASGVRAHPTSGALAPATFSRLAQLVALVIGLSAVASMSLDGPVEFMVG